MILEKGEERLTDINLEYLREAIDGIDNQILKLLNKRMEFVQQVGKLKQKTGGAVYRPDRERAILYRLKSINKGPLKDSAIDTIFLEVFAVSRDLQ
ncbi:MAG: chorismate mutase [Thermoanaerobaculales bacterium]|nr:chorismate mutase [Thermoanaerobaculales bacterium]